MRTPALSERPARPLDLKRELDCALDLARDLEAIVVRGGKRIPFFFSEGIIYKEGQRLTSSESHVPQPSEISIVHSGGARHELCFEGADDPMVIGAPMRDARGATIFVRARLQSCRNRPKPVRLQPLRE